MHNDTEYYTTYSVSKKRILILILNTQQYAYNYLLALPILCSAHRQDWDKLLVPPGTLGGSTVPANWVVPPEVSSDAWSVVLHE